MAEARNQHVAFVPQVGVCGFKFCDAATQLDKLAPKLNDFLRGLDRKARVVPDRVLQQAL
jgi:hypothetical protein